jgi:hypothetical protein
VARNARYDEIAHWYPTWVGDGDRLIADGVGDLLPPTVHGARVLDVAELSVPHDVSSAAPSESHQNTRTEHSLDDGTRSRQIGTFARHRTDVGVRSCLRRLVSERPESA